MLIDLQVHSTYSDGYLTPTELAKFLARQKIKVASLTDHNTVRGQFEFVRACKKLGIKAIPGIELYVTLNNRKFNILWFNYKDDAEFHEILRDSQTRRKGKVRKMLMKLKDRGFVIDIEEALDRYNCYLPVNHLIDDILKNFKNRTKIQRELKTKKPRENEIISEYFRNKKTGILHESYTDITRLMGLRKRIGGQIALNHPGKHNQLKRDFLESLKKIGIDAIEVLSPHHTIGATMYAQSMVREFDFIATGGSDFHKYEGENFPLQSSLEYFRIDSKKLKGIEKIIG